jgi:hypothetical protein
VVDGTRTRDLRSHNPPTSVAACCQGLQNWLRDFRSRNLKAGIHHETAPYSETYAGYATAPHWCIHWRTEYSLTLRPGRRLVRGRSRGCRGPRGPRPGGERLGDAEIRLLSLLEWGMNRSPSSIGIRTGVGQGCEDCLRIGDTWIHLRECLICGHVGCCDQSVPLQRRNPLWFRSSLPRAGLISYSLGA